MANAILTGRFIGKTFVEHLPEFIENCQYGKQIDEFLGIKKHAKTPQASKPIFGHHQVQKNKSDFFENVRDAAMYAIVFYFFQNYAICDFWRLCKICMFFLKT